MEHIKRSMLRLLAEDDDIQNVREFLDINAKFELVDGDYSDANIALINPTAVDDAPACVAKVLDTDEPALFFNYSVEIGSIHSSPATREDPASFDYDIDDERISLDERSHPGLFTANEISQLNAFFTIDKVREIDNDFFQRLEDDAVEAKCEAGDDQDYDMDEDY
jgi:hypothetical protein